MTERNPIHPKRSLRLTQIGFFLVFWVSSVWAGGETEHYYPDVIPGVSVLFRGKGAEDSLRNRVLLQALKETLPNCLNHPFFKAKLPTKWGLLIDGDWIKSEGYYAPDLQIKTEQGDLLPAILLQRVALLNPASILPLLAHELTHLIHVRMRPKEEPWIREGVALLAEFVVTGHFNGALREGFLNPETSLLHLAEFHHRNPKNQSETLSQYGHILQYFYYIYRLCGKNTLLENLIHSQSKSSGIDFISEVFEELTTNATRGHPAHPHACSSFNDSFLAFEKARFFPAPSPPSAFVLFSNLKAEIRSAPQTELPAYSATAYQLGRGDEKCLDGFTPIGTNTCFRVRVE